MEEHKWVTSYGRSTRWKLDSSIAGQLQWI